ncbi:PAS domain S-box protein [Thalassotalea sp. G2M2-11]|uniref:PAS domain-containing protein n=1 Tax=Thalassotalea sp. G2M2-11 TaxID=2787627 RepID=UPI0019D1CE84|nr:PAS domain S-box protein [Thalassotalea sp. G2M2-11]
MGKIIALLVPAFFLLAWFSFEYVEISAMNKAVKEVQRRHKTVSSLEKSNLQFLKNIIIQLSTDSELQRYVMDRNELSKGFVLDNWVRVSEQTKWIYQIRFIANSGLELLRVEYDKEKDFSSHSDTVQNNKNDVYFIEAQNLKFNQVYISPIDLNREYGELSYPLTPVIRFSTPVFHPSEQIAGVFVVNFLADKLIDSANNILANLSGNGVILDSNGDYIQGFDNSTNWSHKLSTSTVDNFKQTNPKVWKKIVEDKTGVVGNNDEKFVFHTLEINGNTTVNPYYFVQRVKQADLSPEYAAQKTKLYLLFSSLLLLLTISLWGLYKRRLVQEVEHHSLALISALFYCEEAIFITDSKWRISVVNKSFCKTTGYETNEVLGMLCSDLYFMENTDLHAAIQSSIKHTGQWIGEVISLRKDGTKVINIMFASAVTNKQGEVSHYVLQMIDISERKQMENELKVAAAAFNTRSAISITDGDGNIIKVNKAFTEITGYEESEVLGKNPRILSSGVHDKKFYQQLWQSIIETGTWQGEIINKHKDGKHFPEWISISAIEDDTGAVKFYVATFEDITERKLLEAQVEKFSTAQDTHLSD